MLKKGEISSPVVFMIFPKSLLLINYFLDLFTPVQILSCFGSVFGFLVFVRNCLYNL